MKKNFIYLVLIGLCLLTGCEKASYSGDSVTGEEQQIEASTTAPLPESEAIVGEYPLIYPAVITLIDPRTMEIVKSFTPQLLGYGTDGELYKANVKKIARDLAGGTKERTGYDQIMVLHKVGENGDVIVEGNPGIVLKESELVDKILTASPKGDHIFLPLYILETDLDIDIPSLDDVTVASFTTYFNGAQSGRSENIELSSNAIHNILVGDGDYFSFNTMVGERTMEKGYQPAPEIINKELVMGIGGGICQTSSTLFNAVDQLGIRITERHHHSLNIGYVPTGRDATVSYGSLDFKFQNTSGAPFLIKSYYSKGALTIAITTSHQYKEILKK
ncbi:VanW family protein [Solibacillus sp. NPDC093137]|uniref:VanW family protein n=1 Tax=Solibacillus sp. NPDC093137 TaxID=3390678 RepID=UPI003D089A9C